MSEWKELEIDNLPPDILTGKYEFMLIDKMIGYVHNVDKIHIIEGLLKGEKYHYRKLSPTPPTHEEIMTKWWDFGIRGRLKVVCYLGGKYYTVDPLDNDFIAWNKGKFIGRESADIPPEGK